MQFQDGVDLDVAQARQIAGNSVSLGVELHALERFRAFSAAREDLHGLISEVGEQILARVGPAGRTANNLDDVVQVIDGDVIAQQNMLALFRLAQVVARAANHHFAAVFQEEPQQLEQAHLARLAAGDGQQDHAERFLHLGELVEVVEDELGLLAALDLDHDAHALAIGFVAHVGDAFDLLGLHQLGDALDQARLIDLVGNFRDDDVLAVLAHLLDGSLGAHDEAAAPFLISLLDAVAAGDVSARGQDPGRARASSLP